MVARVAPSEPAGVDSGDKEDFFRSLKVVLGY
jgi:hypothetical protein